MLAVMTTDKPAELATASDVGDVLPDITTQQAFDLLHTFDPDQKFSHYVGTEETRFTGGGCSHRYSVILTALNEQHSAQQMLTLRAAVETAIEKMQQPPSVKAALLRAEAAQLIAKADQLESSSHDHA